MGKALTREQLQGRKEKAVRFTRDVIGDPERAEEIDRESIEDYADRKRIQLSNSKRRKNVPNFRKQIKDLKQQIADLEEENEGLQEKLDDISELAQTEEDDDDDDNDRD